MTLRPAASRLLPVLPAADELACSECGWILGRHDSSCSKGGGS